MNTAEAFRELAAPCLPGERVKVWIDRASKRCGLSYWRGFDIWYGKARKVEPSEVDAIREALIKKRKGEVANEYRELKTKIERLESLLLLSDPEFFEPQITAAREQLRRTGQDNRPLD